MKKTSIVIAVIVVILIIVSVTKTKNSDTVKIGFLTFPTGPVAIPGQMSVAAAQYAEDVVNKNGGINGKKLEVFIEDYAYDAKRAIPAYQALKTKGITSVATECTSYRPGRRARKSRSRRRASRCTVRPTNSRSWKARPSSMRASGRDWKCPIHAGAACAALAAASSFPARSRWR